MNGLDVDPTGWFVYCNGRRDTSGFDDQLIFKVSLLPYTGDDSWVEGAIGDAWETLCQDELPASANDCEFCAYRADAQAIEIGATS